MSQPQPGASVGGAFSIDLERAPQAIKDLEDARTQLESLVKDAQALGSVNPPAIDQVSIDAAKALSAVAVGGPNSLVVALREGVKSLDMLIQDMKDELDSYRTIESHAASTLGRDDGTA